jgi:hypothetical protein
MTDLDARADRVKAIAECVGGKVLDRNGNTVRVEIPADKTSGLVVLWGMGGFIPIFRRQEFRTGIVSQAFYIYDVDLRPHSAAVETTPHAAAIAITAPTPKFGG